MKEAWNAGIVEIQEADVTPCDQRLAKFEFDFTPYIKKFIKGAPRRPPPTPKQEDPTPPPKEQEEEAATSEEEEEKEETSEEVNSLSIRKCYIFILETLFVHSSCVARILPVLWLHCQLINNWTLFSVMLDLCWLNKTSEALSLISWSI